MVLQDLDNSIDARSVTLSFTGVTDNSLSFQLQGLTGYSKDRGLDITCNGQKKSVNILANNSISPTVTFTGLTSGTTYNITWNLWGDYPLSGSRTAKTSGNPPIQKPVDWNWSTSVRTAMTSKGAFNLTATEWNNFIENVSDTIKWYNNNSSYNLNGAKVSVGEIFSATKFNLVKNAIGGITSTGITDRKAGDEILGDYFITLSLRLATIKNMK